MDENIIITRVDETYYKLTPAPGYMLYNTVYRRRFSEAVVEEAHIRDYVAVPRMAGE